MWGVVIRSHQVLKDVDVTPRLVFREVSPHARLQRSVESFHDARLRLRVVCGDGCRNAAIEPELIYSEIPRLDLSATSLASCR